MPPLQEAISITSGRFFRGFRHVSEWLIAVYLVESTPRGISPKQLERLHGVSYRTATSLVRGFRRNKAMTKTLYQTYVDTGSASQAPPET